MTFFMDMFSSDFKSITFIVAIFSIFLYFQMCLHNTQPNYSCYGPKT
jgi:hypothetical protein